MKKALDFYLGILVPASIVIPLLPAMVKYGSYPAALKAICRFLFLGAIAGAVNSFLAYNKINNMPVGHIYTAIELVLLAGFYKNMPARPVRSKYINIVVFLFLLLCIANLLFWQDVFTYNSYTKSVEAIIIIFFALTCFKTMLDNAGKQPAGMGAVTYINTGLFVYFSSSFCLFVIENVIVTNFTFALLMWSIHATFLLLLYILTAIALWRYKT